MDAIEDALQVLLGLWSDGEDLAVWQMALRAVVVYGVTLLIVRLGKKRFMGRATAFDVILGIMLGSIVSRAITGNSPFFPALAAAATLVAIHWLLTLAAVHWHGFGTIVKGYARLLVRDGEIQWETMRRTHITEHDLEADLRSKGIADVKEVAEARLERSGQVSVLRAKREPKVVEIAVADGVQTVRLEMS